MPRLLALLQAALLGCLAAPHVRAADLTPPNGMERISGPLSGRGNEERKELVEKEGGTPESEAAVANALEWLAAHQMTDGGWSFNHGVANRHFGPINHPGTANATTASTGLALLAFLGAGQSPKEGKYRETVKKGVIYLGNQMTETKDGADLRGKERTTEASMYCHGIATQALLEALALSRDQTLLKPAQRAVDFISAAQDKTGGGWRYTPGQAGDTSVTCWQVMALNMAKVAALEVPDKTPKAATQFLALVASNSGANFGYTVPGATPSMTASGLLTRMHLDGSRENLEQGVAFLNQQTPHANNMYFNYHATQVMFHWGGAPWKRWNALMRDQLVKAQEKNGAHTGDKGSWYYNHQVYGEKGGRLYDTALSALVLETYYRHAPRFRSE